MQAYEEHVYLAWLFSASLHLSVAYLFFFGLPANFSKKPLPQAPQPIIFELLPVKDLVNAPNQQKQPIAEDKQEAAKIVENTQPEKVIETPEQAEPTVEQPIIKEAPVIPEEKKPAEIVPLKEEPPKPKEVEKKIATPSKPVIDSKKKAPVVADLDSLLKNLEKSSSKQAKTAKNDNKKDIVDSLFDEQQELATTFNSIIKTQIRQAWNPPLGGKNVDQIKVTYYIELSSDGYVQLVRPKNKDCGGASAGLCNAFIEGAERAIWKASPLKNLPPERYSTWQSFDFYFDLKAR